MHFPPCDTDVNVNVTVNIFRGLMEGKVEEITLAPHCEAMLAAFVKFCPDNELTTNDGLAQICKVLGFIHPCLLFRKLTDYIL